MLTKLHSLLFDIDGEPRRVARMLRLEGVSRNRTYSGNADRSDMCTSTTPVDQPSTPLIKYHEALSQRAREIEKLLVKTRQQRQSN